MSDNQKMCTAYLLLENGSVFGCTQFRDHASRIHVQEASTWTDDDPRSGYMDGDNFHRERDKMRKQLAEAVKTVPDGQLSDLIRVTEEFIKLSRTTDSLLRLNRLVMPVVLAASAWVHGEGPLEGIERAVQAFERVKGGLR